MKLSVRTVRTIDPLYGIELRRIYYFVHLILPVLSAFSILTGQYFITQKIVINLLPNISPEVGWGVGVLTVVFIELIKYFISPIFFKSRFHRNYRLALFSGIFMLLFYAVSVYLSMHGVRYFYLSQDNRQAVILAEFDSRENDLTNYHNSIIHRYSLEFDSLKESLEAQQGENLLSKLEDYNNKIEQYERSKRIRAKNTVNKDSVYQLYNRLIDRVDLDKRILERSSSLTQIQLDELTLKQDEIKKAIQKKEEALSNLLLEKQTTVEEFQQDQNFIANNILYISLFIEFLIFCSLTFIQYYKLKLIFPSRIKIEKSAKTHPSQSAKIEDEKSAKTHLNKSAKKEMEKGVPANISKTGKKNMPQSFQNKKVGRRSIPDQVKQKIISEIIAGVSIRELAEKYNKGERTIHRIKKEAAKKSLQRGELAQEVKKKFNLKDRALQNILLELNNS